MARIKDTCLTGQHFSPLWNLDLGVYIQELDVEGNLCVGRRGKTRGGRGKTLHAFFHVESGFTACNCGEGKGARAMM